MKNVTHQNSEEISMCTRWSRNFNMLEGVRGEVASEIVDSGSF